MSDRPRKQVLAMVAFGAQRLNANKSGVKVKPRIMYIELKTHAGGHDDHGPARIGRITFNRTGKTLLYQGKRFQKSGTDSCANYHDVETGEGYWISGPKKNGEDRHRHGGGPVEIDEDIREEYWIEIRNRPEKKNDKFT